MTAPIISLKSVQLTLDSRAGPVSILNGVGLEIEAGQSVAGQQQLAIQRLAEQIVATMEVPW